MSRRTSCAPRRSPPPPSGPPGGATRLTTPTASGAEGGRTEASLEPARAAVAVTIRDDGCGIPAGIRDRIFDPFFSTKKSKKNAGLGLSIRQHIVELHKGG